VSKTEWAIRIFFKSGSSFNSVRMSEIEARNEFNRLDPRKPENESIKEIQLYSYEIEETEIFQSRIPMWGA
jgi:hypothetical protein